MKILRNYTFLLLLLCSSAGHAALTIEITQGVEGALPIAVIPFGWSGSANAAPVNIAAVVVADLRRSGRFAPLPDNELVAHPADASQVKLHNWRMINIDNLVIGKVTQDRGGDYIVQFELMDVLRGKQILAKNFTVDRTRLRQVAHHIADLVYEELTGLRGAFNTRVAYITASGPASDREYTLVVADSDGYDPQTILTSKQPLMSPSWSPDGRFMAYVSFEKKLAEVYVQEVQSGVRRKLAAYRGINGAPRWSPDGRRLALTLSRDGNPEIYSMDVESGALKRLTRNLAIDTEPVWSPDGGSIVFTSNRGGTPQLYMMPAKGGKARRLTFDGAYNADADFSPDGRKLAMVHRESGGYRIAVLDLKSGVLSVVTDGKFDESPSFSPNGSIIIYATGEGSRDVLAAVSVDGRFRQRLSLQVGNVREPAWSPYER